MWTVFLIRFYFSLVIGINIPNFVRFKHKGLADTGFLEKMKERWNLHSLLQVVLVLIVFSLTGMSVVFLKPYVFRLFGIEELTGFKGALLYLLLIFPLYQILLLFYGTLLGQFSFFWKWEVKTFKSIGKLFKKKKTD